MKKNVFARVIQSRALDLLRHSGNHRWTAALTAVMFVAIMSGATTALADGRYYYSDSAIQTSHPDWLKGLPNSLKLSELSIPGTHDTMAYDRDDLELTDFVETQGLSLKKQLEAGIRFIDIRAHLIGNVFAIHHGSVYLEINFGAVLQIVDAFLEAHPAETVIVSIQNEASEAVESTRTYNQTFKWYRDETTYGRKIWNPKLAGNTNYPGYVAATHVGGQNYDGEIPTLGEVRGKMVIWRGGFGFSRGQSFLGDWLVPIEYFGIDNSFNKQRVFFPEIELGLPAVVVASMAIDILGQQVDVGDSSAMHDTRISNVGTIPLPFAYAKDVNPIILDYLLKNKINRTTGIITMDYPGAALIDAIIAQNFRYFPDPRDFATDFNYMFNNIAYNGTEIGGDRQAADRATLLQNFTGWVLPSERMNTAVWIDDIRFGFHTDDEGLFAETDWINTDNIFETREYKAIVFNTTTLPSVYDEQDLGAFFFAEINKVQSLFLEQLKANALHTALAKRFPKHKWAVLAMYTDDGFGFDNLAYFTYPNAIKSDANQGNGFRYITWGWAREPLRFDEDIEIAQNQTMPSGETWIIEAGQVLSIDPHVVFKIPRDCTLINYGTIVNNGRIELLPGGAITNQSSGLINSIGPIHNGGDIVNSGDLYGLYVFQNAPAPNPVVAGYFLGRDSVGGGDVCAAIGGTSWNAESNGCTVESFWLRNNRALIVDAGVTLTVTGTLSSDGTINNAGIIDNSIGTVNDCGVYEGNEPTPNPRIDCALSDAATVCVALGGEWDLAGNGCEIRVSDATVNPGSPLTIPPGVTYSVYGALTNFGTIVNTGTLINYGRIVNDTEAYINNYSEMIMDYESSSGIGSTLLNEGSIVNFATFQNVSDSNGGIEGFGMFDNACGAEFLGYTGVENLYFDNCRPNILMFEPSINITDAGTVSVSWEDDDLDSNATITLYYRPIDLPEAAGVLIAGGLGEDADGEADQYQWDLAGMTPGTYSVYAVISDEISSVVSAAAEGAVSILPEGGIAMTLNPVIQGDMITLTWPVSATGFVLQSSSEPTPEANWRDVTTDPIYQNGQIVIELPRIGESKFYRLKLP